MTSARYKSVVKYIKQHWTKGESLKQIAAKFNVDPGNLDRLFLKSEGQTFKHFQYEMRKEYIMQRVREGRVYAYELADELGFSSASNFSRWVRRRLEKSFRELRECYKE